VRDLDGNITSIIEEKDADSKVRAITEINTGIMVLPTDYLSKWLKSIKTKNAQGEYYLTDVIGMAVREGVPIRSTQALADYEILGVNSRDQLAELERTLQLQKAKQLLDQGVTLLDPARIDIRGELTCGQDVWIDVGCIFEGQVHLGDGVRIGPYCVVKDSTIGKESLIDAFTHIDGAQIGSNNRIGPYGRIRPGTKLAVDVHIGNFVEVKNSSIAAQSKANHLAYVGDSVVGARVNIGAGTITCNYDGVNKHQTIIEDDVFIGSDTQLVAPIKVGKGATLGAGTTLTKDAPAGKLTVSRAKQISLEWDRPKKKTQTAQSIKTTRKIK
jgi:bifunctional UDP-N-acetylglucosamine pyrophosphorylase/glucosamine-1-phosphate N-acetyltransferase